MDRVKVTHLVSHIPHEEVIGDVMEFYEYEISAHEIKYSERYLHLLGLVLKVVNPRLAFAQALELFQEPKMCHWPNYMVVADNTLYDGEVNYGKFCVIGGYGFGYIRDGEHILRMPHVGHVKIGKNVILHNHVCIDRGVTGATIIGDDCKIDNFVHIAHGVRLGKGNTLAAHTVIEGSCQVGDGNTFGTSVIVQRKVKIGSNNIFGSGCVVTKDCGDNGVYVGNPARLIRYETKRD